jgi:hypothetical protein
MGANDLPGALRPPEAAPPFPATGFLLPDSSPAGYALAIALAVEALQV